MAGFRVVARVGGGTRALSVTSCGHSQQHLSATLASMIMLAYLLHTLLILCNLN
ncbi:MAG: hypothetical protein Q7J66_14120 [Hydrogenophaga sp.]|uniref:hypothetical protein n=1 Tax=Hydrogenophaga sp. TaxID=1904254 RepID=UPI002727F9A0|nr:hypothetical protein [Hydrogenophaga sp.]MDO9481727.1 hypothetical protein [Hydrogenophaga sp.]MDP3805090.1 hypothetical protein [Hydrogenophaga sp.]